jgi:hypothetical protein
VPGTNIEEHDDERGHCNNHWKEPANPNEMLGEPRAANQQRDGQAHEQDLEDR